MSYDLVISAGVGAAESRRFVFLLAGRLEQLAADCGVAIADVVSSGDDRAPRSIALRLAGPPGALAAELGTHVLIHRSAARGRRARKRWFAAISLHVAVDQPAATPPLARADLVITACRAGGPGGQHVNKVSSAVRVAHLPSGLAVRSAAARSQHANLAHALQRLAALLAARDAADAAAAGAVRRTSHHRLERGRAVRTYGLDPGGLLVVSGAAP